MLPCASVYGYVVDTDLGQQARIRTDRISVRLEFIPVQLEASHPERCGMYAGAFQEQEQSYWQS
jgi:hypothetical protein